MLNTSGQAISRDSGTQDEFANATNIAASGRTNTFVQVALRASINCSSTSRRSASFLGNIERRTSSTKFSMGLMAQRMRMSEVKYAAPACLVQAASLAGHVLIKLFGYRVMRGKFSFTHH